MSCHAFYRIILFFAFLSINLILSGQSRADLEKRKKESLEQIKLSREILEKTKRKRSNSIYQLNLLNKTISTRSILIKNYEYEIEMIENEMARLEKDISRNNVLLNELKKQYGSIIRNTYRNIEDEYVLMYILSSQDINQGYQRIRYIKYLNKYRKNLFEEINNKNDSLEVLNNTFEDRKKENELALANIQKERESLYKDRRSKEQTVDALRGKEKELMEVIKRNEETRRNIEAEIRRIIEEEARRARAENRRFELTPEERIISDDFKNNRGGLPWPTIQGVVTSEFGEHPHPVIPGIKIRSNGIDISTVENTEVRAIFKGEVTVVSAILGANYTVIIKHGNYRSVYQNLVNVRVKVGDSVETKEVIGSVGTNVDNETTLHFELWDGMSVNNPDLWLSK